MKLNKDFISNYIFHIFIGNLDKLQVLKSNHSIKFEGNNGIVDYKINIQNTMSHQNMANIDDDYKVILELIFSNSNRKIFEINQADLIKIIEKLQEIYGKIKV